MDRPYKKVTTEYLANIHNETIDVILEYLPKSKHKCFLELLDIERELTLREEN